MKTRLIFNSFLFATAVFTLLPNCSGGKKAESDDTQAQATEEKAPEAAASQFVVNENFQQQLGNVFTSYVSLKDAFVASNTEKVKSEASTTSEAVAAVDMKLLSG